jgi:hypothetical protein
LEEFHGQYIAVIGGFRKLDPTNAAEAKSQAKTLGAELAKANFGLVVYFSNDESLEPHVVDGYAAALPDPPPAKAIRKRFAASQRSQVQFPQEKNPKLPDLFDPQLYPSNEWEDPFYQSLAEEKGVDGVLLVAGGDSTLNAGWIAVGRHLPVLAIDGFDGSAGKIRNYLAKASRDYPSSATHSTKNQVDWLRRECDKSAALRQEALENEGRYSTEALEKQRRDAAVSLKFSQKVLTGFAIVALLAVVTLALEFASSDAYPLLMFLGLMSAGAMGALGRAVFWESEAREPWRSLVLGVIAGFVVGLAYLVPQLVGSPQFLFPKKPEEITPARVEFLTVLLAAVSAGVGFDTVFNRLRDRAGELDGGARSGQTISRDSATTSGSSPKKTPPTTTGLTTRGL